MIKEEKKTCSKQPPEFNSSVRNLQWFFCGQGGHGKHKGRSSWFSTSTMFKKVICGDTHRDSFCFSLLYDTYYLSGREAELCIQGTRGRESNKTKQTKKTFGMELKKSKHLVQNKQKEKDENTKRCC